VTHALDLAYVALWIEPDAEWRQRAVSELWTEDAVHILQPPQEVLRVAAALDIGATFQARGHRELEARVVSACVTGRSRVTCRRRLSRSRIAARCKFRG